MLAAKEALNKAYALTADVAIFDVALQVVTLAVYLFFVFQWLGGQFLETDNSADIYVPVATILQFVFYFGWLRVRCVLMGERNSFRVELFHES